MNKGIVEFQINFDLKWNNQDHMMVFENEGERIIKYRLGKGFVIEELRLFVFWCVQLVGLYAIEYMD